MGYDWIDNQLQELRAKAYFECKLSHEQIRQDFLRGKEVMRNICKGN